LYVFIRDAFIKGDKNSLSKRGPQYLKRKLENVE
jgi:hypothetical protein